jgi:hypothetical protein
MGRGRGLRGSWGILGAFWHGRGWDTAGHVEETVIPLLTLLEHLQQEVFSGAGNSFPFERGLLPCLGFAELLLEHGDHVHVDVKRV